MQQQRTCQKCPELPGDVSGSLMHFRTPSSTSVRRLKCERVVGNTRHPPSMPESAPRGSGQLQ
eukprot:6237638-Alexandrium_andersonii.AAC.1